MNVIVIGKPRIDVTEIVDNFPLEGKDKKITKRIISNGGISVYVACMLAKWGINVYYSGVVGGEEEGIKLKSKLEEYHIDTKFVEVNYETKTNKNYSVLNESNGTRTNIIFDNEQFLTKHKFDFDPDYIIVDGTDMVGAIGASNNYPNAKMIMLANVVSKEYYNLSKRCTYVVASENFASALTKIAINYNKSKTLVDVMQKIQGLENAKYTLNLLNHGTLYVKDRQVKYIPKIEVKPVDNLMMEAAFLGAFCYGIISDLDMDVIGKICNMACYKASEKLGTIDNILDKQEIFDACSIKVDTKPESMETIESKQAIESNNNANTEASNV